MSSDTFIFSVAFMGPKGEMERRNVEARSEEEAREFVNIPVSRIVSTKRNRVAELDRLLPKPGPSIETQARILAVFAAQVTSGDSPSRSFDRCIAGYPSLRAKQEEVRKLAKVSEKMALLKFDPQLLLLAEVGENSGLIGQVMAGAADEIIARQKIMNDIKVKVIPSLGVAVLGLLCMLILPIFVYKPILSIKEARGMKMTTNVSTDLLTFLGPLMENFLSWVVLIGAMIAIGVTAKLWWPHVKGYWGFSFIESFFRVQRAYGFVSAFLPLFSRGVMISKTIEMMQKFASGGAKKAYVDMARHLESGGSLSTAFESEFWDPILRDCMRGFDTMRQDAKVSLLERMQPLMSQEMGKIGNRLGTIAGGAGMFMAVAITLIIFHGLTIPLMTISTPFGR